MEPREFDLKRRISRDTMTSVVNRGIFTVFGCDFSPIPWGNTSIYDWSHCISRNPPFQVKLSRFHTKLTILNLMNTLFLSKNKFGQIWEKRILRWGKISGIEVFLEIHGMHYRRVLYVLYTKHVLRHFLFHEVISRRRKYYYTTLSVMDRLPQFQVIQVLCCVLLRMPQ